MTKEQILHEIESRSNHMFQYSPELWSQDTDEALNSLLDSKLIRRCSDSFPDFMNSHFEFIDFNAVPEVVSVGVDSWLKVTKKRISYAKRR